MPKLTENKNVWALEEKQKERIDIGAERLLDYLTSVLETSIPEENASSKRQYHGITINILNDY